MFICAGGIMESSKVIKRIKEKFDKSGNPSKVPLLRGVKFFKAKYISEGIEVDNFGRKPFLPWIVFTETVSLLEKSGGEALKGNAMDSKLGDRKLPLNSVEGHIANLVYGIQPGNSVFRRITPVACILIWSGLCMSISNKLSLKR